MYNGLTTINIDKGDDRVEKNNRAEKKNEKKADG